MENSAPIAEITTVQPYWGRTGPDNRHPKDRLSRREREILSLLADGIEAKDIANRLFISPKTVDTHRQNILEKLEVDTQMKAVLLGIRWGIVPCPCNRCTMHP